MNLFTATAIGCTSTTMYILNLVAPRLCWIQENMKDSTKILRKVLFRQDATLQQFPYMSRSETMALPSTTRQLFQERRG
jgi:hypothetical protein